MARVKRTMGGAPRESGVFRRSQPPLLSGRVPIPRPSQQAFFDNQLDIGNRIGTAGEKKDNDEAAVPHEVADRALAMDEGDDGNTGVMAVAQPGLDMAVSVVSSIEN
jgi:hypothetical protein